MIAVIVILGLGLAEVLLIGKLHEMLGTKDLVLLYLGTTGAAAAVGWIFYGNYKNEKQKPKPGNKFSKRLKSQSLTEADYRAMASVMYVVAYIVGCFLVAIPGILTDILGALLFVPSVNRLITSNFFAKAVTSYYASKVTGRGDR